jgi:very-short-patch-repair endonuclease
LNGEPLSPRIGSKERECLDFLQEDLKYQIIRNVNQHGFFPDGYIKELNLVIEFDEEWHKLKCWIDRDKDREDQLISLLGCKIFRISEHDWDEGKDLVLKEFKHFLEREYAKTDI